MNNQQRNRETNTSKSVTANGAKETKKVKKKRPVTATERLALFGAKWVFIIFLLFASIILGLVVGFSVVGDGNVSDVFDFGTWKHLYDLVFKT